MSELEKAMTFIEQLAEERREKRRRIAVCLKACKGISTHALEYGVIAQLQEACREILRILSLEESPFAWDWRRKQLLTSRLELVLQKALDPEPSGEAK